MSTRNESASGLIWNVQKETLPLGGGIKEKVLHVRIRRVPENGSFIDEIRAAHPDVGALSLDLDEYDDCTMATADLAGLETLTNLKLLFVHLQGKLVASRPIDASLLDLRRLIVGYYPEVSDALVSAPKLSDLSIESSPLDTLLNIRANLEQLTLFRTKKSICPKAWDKVSGLDELNIDQAGTLHVDAPAGGWPPHVFIRGASSVKGIVQASQIQPFNHLYLTGVRLLDVGNSFWDLKVRSMIVGFTNKPPKWLVEKWPHRPEKWGQWFKVSYHPSLPGSEECWFEDEQE